VAHPPSPAAEWCATCQPIIATAGRGYLGIGCRLPAADTLRIGYILQLITSYVAVKKKKLMRKLTVLRVANLHNKPLQ